MKYVLLLLIASTATIGMGFNGFSGNVDREPVARMEVGGVEVLVNQVQIQRLGPTAQAPKKLKLLVAERDEFKRTITISLSQKNQGTTNGPTHLELSNGQKLRPFMNGNQHMMSVIANAAIPNGFDFAEYWFQVPNESALKNIFPITIVHQTTNDRQEAVVFRFENIEP